MHGDISTIRGYLAFAFPLMVFMSVLEAIVVTLRRPGSYHWKGLAVSIVDLVGRTLLIKAVPFSLTAVVMSFLWSHRIATLSLDSVSAWLLLFFGQELCYYWYHRTSHQVQWFWATHAVHHSSTVLNLSSVYRVGWMNRFFSPLLFFAPLAWIGFHPAVVVMAFTGNLLYQVWIHNTTIPKLGWLEYIINTPSSHRVHHASNVRYLDSNYGGVLIVFDRLFGTYVEEGVAGPCRYGLVKGPASESLMGVQIHEWTSMARNAWSARKPSHVLRYLFGPPGWRPKGGATTRELQRGASEDEPPSVHNRIGTSG